MMERLRQRQDLAARWLLELKQYHERSLQRVKVATQSHTGSSTSSGSSVTLE
ncbi:MAG: hypothetical protein KDI63_14820 [Gammaproteobacteria bacterium]|nr:hypothetical protein [Gammaproteobacteria bacterium]